MLQTLIRSLFLGGISLTVAVGGITLPYIVVIAAQILVPNYDEAADPPWLEAFFGVQVFVVTGSILLGTVGLLLVMNLNRRALAVIARVSAVRTSFEDPPVRSTRSADKG